LIKIVAEKLIPYENDPLMLDFSTDNIYSEHMAKLVAWHRHYTRFWKQSVLYCDERWPEFINSKAPGYRGLTGEGEPKFLNAVTGKKFSFLDGMELGRKIWNLDNAIWTLQGGTETSCISPTTSICPVRRFGELCHVLSARKEKADGLYWLNEDI
jgi:aldehyde:ferredoxin oxidoreductase